MRKLLLTTILSVFILSCYSQTSIWKISKDGNELYLAGAVHILRQSDYPLPEEFNSAFKNSEKIVFETDIEQLENPEVAQTLIEKGMLQDNKTLKDVLSKKVYKELELEFSKLSLSLINLSRLKPSMAILTLTAIKMQQLGIVSEGVDKYYFSKSKENKKEISFLESANEQIETMLNMGEGNEDEFIKYSLKDFKHLDKELTNLIAAWRDGTSIVMDKYLKEMKTEFPDIYKSLLIERNNNWLPKIENYLSDYKSEFIIVGYLHLHGSDGLLEKLRERGYIVEQYKL